MFSDRYPTRAAILPKLGDIDLLAAREGAHAEARQRIIPKEFAVFADWAVESVNGAFGDATLRHGPDSLTSFPGKRPVSTR
jgi:hypothetical protein